MFSRNIGLITKKDQNKLKKSTVLISGVGGMGGICAEALARMGVESLILIDPDQYELSNINRQIHCNSENLGKFKSEEVAKSLKKINPNLKVKFYNEGLSQKLIDEILNKNKVSTVVNGMDEILPSLILERTVRKHKITLVDAWITPYASVFVTNPNDEHWESFLDFPTKDKTIEEITQKDLFDSLEKEIEYTFSKFNPYSIISKEKVLKIIYKKIKRPSFVPVVWLSGTLMANEVFKIITNKETVASNKGIFFNQYTYEIIK
jgi:molybdopterin/thiamine biosynthesis adenylyltransferase